MIKTSYKSIKGRKNEQLFETDHLKNDLKARALKGGSITMVARVFDFAIGMIGTIILARLLTPADFGLVAMAVLITGFFLIFKDLGLSDATVQSQDINHEQVSTLFWINLTFCIIIMFVICILSPVIAWFYKEPRLQLITIISASSFLFAGLSTQHLALLRRGMLFQKIAWIEMASVLLSMMGSVAMAATNFGYWAIVARPIFQAIIAAIGVWILSGWRPGVPVRGAGVKSLVKFGANTMGFYLVNYFARNMDKALIGWRNGATELGFYNKAYHLFIAPISQITIPLQGVAVTTLTKLRNEPDKYKHFFLNAMGLLTFVGMPISTFLASTGYDMILLILGPQWIQAAQIFAILGFGAGIQILYASQGWLHVSLGRSDRWFKWGLIGSSLMVLSFFAGLPFGARGVAAGYTISLYLLTPWALWYAGRPVKLTLQEMVSGVWKYYVASITAGIISGVFTKSGIIGNLYLRIFSEFALFVTVYLILVIVLYKSTRPINQFYKVAREMLPGKQIKHGNKD